MMPYRLSLAAEADLVRIYVDGVERFGVRQAEQYQSGLNRAFDFLADNPRAARERLDLEPPVRIHPVGAHVIIYVLSTDGIFVARVRHGRENWLADLVRF